MTVHGRVLRPHGHLLRQGLLAWIAFTAPVFVVLYFLTIPHGPWLAVLVTHALAAIALVLAIVAYARTAIWVDQDGITERGFFGFRRRVPVADIGSIVFAETFGATPPQTLPQLFVCDRQGRQLVRMRGQFWSRENMDVVVETLDVPYDSVAAMVSTRELRDRYPGLLFWFERHPVIAALAFAAATAVVGIVVFAVLGTAGVLV